MTDSNNSEENSRSEDVHHHGLEIEDVAQEIRTDNAILANAIGGWSGVIDSGLPTAIFLVVFVVSHNNLKASLIGAVASGVLLALVRLKQGKSLQQVTSGFIGIALSAYLARRTGHSENFFAIGIIQNIVYLLACLVSVFLRKPLLGYIVSALRSQDSSWKKSPELVRTYSAITWLWVLVFGIRVAITVPLYLAHSVALLGTAKLALGWPLYAFALYMSFRMVSKISTKSDS